MDFDNYLEREINLIQIDLSYLKNRINTIKFSYSRYFTNFLNSCDATDYFLYSFLDFYNNCVLSEEVVGKSRKISKNGSIYEYNVPTENRFSVLERANRTY